MTPYKLTSDLPKLKRVTTYHRIADIMQHAHESGLIDIRTTILYLLYTNDCANHNILPITQRSMSALLHKMRKEGLVTVDKRISTINDRYAPIQNHWKLAVRE